MTFELGRFFAGGEIPDANRLVKRSTYELLAVRRIGQSINWIGMPGDDLSRFCRSIDKR